MFCPFKLFGGLLLWFVYLLKLLWRICLSVLWRSLALAGDLLVRWEGLVSVQQEPEGRNCQCQVWIKLKLCLDSVSLEYGSKLLKWISFQRAEKENNGMESNPAPQLNLNSLSLPSNISLFTPPFCCFENDSEKVILVFLWRYTASLTTFFNFERESINWIWFAKCCYKWCSFVYLDTEFLERKSSFHFICTISFFDTLFV